ncbi:hypothetical protein VULLAG_LOCUS21642 [Vulpes lagopus]
MAFCTAPASRTTATEPLLPWKMPFVPVLMLFPQMKSFYLFTAQRLRSVQMPHPLCSSPWLEPVCSQQMAVGATTGSETVRPGTC